MTTRRQKYPNTTTFRFFNANPKGRLTCDCVTRAICTATGKDYNDVVRDMAEIQIETGYEASSKEGIDRLMQKYGWQKQKQIKKPNGRKYTGVEFCKYLNAHMYGDYGTGIVANLGGNHTVAIMPTDNFDKQENWKVFDIWDSTDGCIGNYWIKSL